MRILSRSKKPKPGSRGKSASAPGHNKPAGQKAAVGRGESWQQVAKANKIKDPRKLQIGSKVKVNGETRTVKKGDTLWGMTHGKGSRGKSAAAPGHNKPAGQKNAVGRGKLKPVGTAVPRPGRPGATPGHGRLPVQPMPPTGGAGSGYRPVQPIPPGAIPPGHGRLPVEGRPPTGLIGGSSRVSPNWSPTIGAKPAGSGKPTPGSMPVRSLGSSTPTPVRTDPGTTSPIKATGIARAKQTPAGTRAQGVPFRTSTSSAMPNSSRRAPAVGASASMGKLPKKGRKLSG